MAPQIPANAGALMGPSRILVPCDGSDIAFSALALACDVARRNKGRVYAAHVIVVRRSLPLDAELGPETRRGNEILARAEAIGSQMEASVETELIQARDAAASIVDEANNLGVEAIFLGLELKDRIGEPTIGDNAGLYGFLALPLRIERAAM